MIRGVLLFRRISRAHPTHPSPGQVQANHQVGMLMPPRLPARHRRGRREHAEPAFPGKSANTRTSSDSSSMIKPLPFSYYTQQMRLYRMMPGLNALPPQNSVFWNLGEVRRRLRLVVPAPAAAVPRVHTPPQPPRPSYPRRIRCPGRRSVAPASSQPVPGDDAIGDRLCEGFAARPLPSRSGTLQRSSPAPVQSPTLFAQRHG